MTPLRALPAEGDVPQASPAGEAPRSARHGRWADRLYLGLCAVAALVAVVVVAYLVTRTVIQARPAIRQIGFGHFLAGRQWSPSTGEFGALPALYGTLVTSAIAMVVAVPLAVGVALATTVILPRRLRAPVAGIIDLLAAIPSVVYGLLGLLVLVPAVKPVLEWIAGHNPGIGAFDGPVLGGRSLLLAGLVLAVMILPIITAVVREVLATVPVEQCEAALALGATRWEMVRGSMLPWARSGIVGASALGLGRAVGETIAVAMIIGSQPTLFKSLLGSGQTLAGTIAFEYNGAGPAPHASALVPWQSSCSWLRSSSTWSPGCSSRGAWVVDRVDATHARPSQGSGHRSLQHRLCCVEVRPVRSIRWRFLRPGPCCRGSVSAGAGVRASPSSRSEGRSSSRSCRS